jgi:peptidoglycan/xylan/chitin deacetylase (PgdA/CDA1 family)
MKIPILMYHSISDGNNPLSVSIENFDKQMRFMSQNGYKTMSLQKLTNIPDRKSFIITFDDGYEDIFLNALPILKKYDFTATCFFVSNFIGKYNAWDENKKEFIKLNLMNINQISLWIDNNMDVGSHTSDHKNLVNLDYNEKTLQIINPKKYFNEVFKLDVKTFSYPFGSFDDECFNIVKDNYNFAVTTNRSRYIFNKFNNCKLPRVPINKKDNIFKFYLKINTIYEDIKFKN